MEKQIKSCKNQIDIQDYINCIHVDLKKTCLGNAEANREARACKSSGPCEKNIINKHTHTHTHTNTLLTHTHTYARTHTHTHTQTRTHREQEEEKN